MGDRTPKEEKKDEPKPKTGVEAGTGLFNPIGSLQGILMQGVLGSGPELLKMIMGGNPADEKKAPPMIGGAINGAAIKAAAEQQERRERMQEERAGREERRLREMGGQEAPRRSFLDAMNVQGLGELVKGMFGDKKDEKKPVDEPRVMKAKRSLNAYVVLDSEAAMTTFIKNIPDEFQNREQMTALRDKLGIGEMKANERLVIYSDPLQTLLFKATEDDKGNVTLTESLSLAGKNNQPTTANEIVRKVMDPKLEWKKVKPDPDTNKPFTVPPVPKDMPPDVQEWLQKKVLKLAMATAPKGAEVAVAMPNAPLIGDPKQTQI